MTVFLRWGVFGLLAISALIYAYRVNERSDDIRTRLEERADEQRRKDARSLPAPVDPAAAVLPENVADSAKCAEAVQLALDAAAAARAGEPLDRVLRQARIAWQEDQVRKAELATAAELGYSLADTPPEDIRGVVIEGCRP
ncbi:MAG TPA: hypothetical protein P5528_13520 [Steroidobacteraceae bacterium]|nr:hypothetical protein [Steroidobacteraceae bacterium]HRX90455.1 hypothetical protein [Steroidobacteraceae bacterium]